MQFKYDYTIKKGLTLPLINVQVRDKGEDKVTGYVALVDSGAVFSVFHADIAEVLGIDLSSINEQVVFSGIGRAKRTLSGKLYVVEIMLAQKGKSHRFDCPVVFSEDVHKDGHPLLGMGGFFDKFSKISFDNNRKKVILEV